MDKNNKKNYGNTNFLKDIWKFLEGNKLKFSFFVFIRALSEIGPFAIAFLLGMTIDFFTTYETGQELMRFYILVILIGVIGVSQVLIRMWSKMNCSIIGAKTRKRVRELSMSRLMDLELKWHEKEDTGSKIQKINYGGHYIFFYDFTNNHLIIITMGIF